MTDGTGTTTRVYDAFNRTTSKTVPYIGTSTYVYDITAGMDAGCMAQTTTDPKNNITCKVYDRVGRLFQVIADGKTSVYTYLDNGSVKNVVYSDGSREDYTYTDDNRLETLTNRKADSTIIDSYSYTYDNAHNMLSKIDARGTTSYTYDSQNRLVIVTEPSGKVTTYTFDAAGNRANQTVVLGMDTTITTYIYDSQNRLTGTAEVLNGVTTETVVYTYDNNGNQLSKTSTAYIAGIPQIPVVEQTNTYDLLNQLISTVTSLNVTVLNTYNGDGLRVGKSVNGSLTRYLYEFDKVVLEENYLGDQTGRNVYGINLLARQVGGDIFLYMYNGHADVTALLDTAGNVAATYYYDAFGNILDQTGTINNNILYAGYQYDFETGLYYLNARMYDPVTARFMQEDTYAGEYNDPLSLNLYTYCKNEPLMYSDPTGHNTLDDYDYQKKAEERQTRSSSTLDDYAYQNQTRIAKDRQSKSVDDYYYNKNTSDAQLKAQTLEQQRPTITSTAKSIPDVCKFLGNVAQIKSDEYKNNLDPVFGLINSLYDAQFASFEKCFGVNNNTQGYNQAKSIYKFGVGYVEGCSSAVLDLANDFNKQNDPIYQLSHVIEMANSTVSLLNNPNQMNAIANAIYHPQQTLNAIGKGISTSFQQTISDPYKSGNFTGQATVFIAPFFIGAGEAGAASDVFDAEKTINVAAKIDTDIMEGTVKTINPNEIRFSQTSVNEAEEIIQSMKANGWKGDPIDVVKMSDGNLTSMDNTRVLAAKYAEIDVKAVVHDATEALPQDLIKRFTTKKGVPQTWGDAVNLRIGKQGAAYRNTYPNGSNITGWDGR